MAKMSAESKKKLVEVAESGDWLNNPEQREQAKRSAEDFMNKFGIFVGLFNRLNKTSFSVQKAAWTPGMIELYSSVRENMEAAAANNPRMASSTTSYKPSGRLAVNKKASKKTKASTKKLSYEQFQVQNGTSVAYTIYKHLKDNQAIMTRTELAKALNLRVSTVCGAVFQLVDSGLLKVVGKTMDKNSNREVETLTFR